MKISEMDYKIELIIQKNFPGSKLIDLWPFKGGISAGMIGFEFEQVCGVRKKMVLRIPVQRVLQNKLSMAEYEFKLLKYLHSQGLPIALPLYLDLSGKIFPEFYFIIEYIEGEPEFNPSNIKDFLFQFAFTLVNIHSIDILHQDLFFLREDDNFPLSPIEKKFNTELILEKLLLLWPLRQRNRSLLLHGDFWPGNILWRYGMIAAVIDWEDCRKGEPLMDFAISRLDILCIFGIEAFKFFSDSYKSMMKIDYTMLPCWDLWAALRLVRMSKGDFSEWVKFYPPFGRMDITEDWMMEHYSFFVNHALKDWRIL